MRAKYFNRDIKCAGFLIGYTLPYSTYLVWLIFARNQHDKNAWENEWNAKRTAQKIYYDSNKTSEIKREDINFTNDHQ